MWTDEELTGGQVLAHRAFVQVAGRGVPPPADRTRGGVRCGRPLIYPIPAEDLPASLRGRAGPARHRYVGAVFAFDLDVLPAGQRYTGARFEVTLSDPQSRAIRLAPDGDELGLVHTETAVLPASAVAARTVAAAETRPGLLRRLAARANAPRAWTTGVQTASFGWVHDDPRGRLLLPRTYGMHALLELPAAAAEVAGALSVRVETSGPAGRRDGALADAVPFAEPLHAAGPAGAAVRLCLAADVVGYSQRHHDESEVLQRDLVEVLGRARNAAGIRDSEVSPQPQGDGQFTVLPVGIDESAVIPAMLGELGARLIDRDRGRPAEQRMRLRVALHRGLVKEGANGWIGNAPIAVHRILDSEPLREAVRNHPAATFALGVPDVLYRDVIQAQPAGRPPLASDFEEMTVDLPAKNFVERGWLYVGPRAAA
jgi:hypothetical protein